ncbi:MAG: helix-turn-helix domain-containing protein [Thiotrichales bacterium]|nr:helix-turn-helix domain-containing protein [Thiotrichales bacterium]
MDLTIAELARAVDKSETYVRQHIHRKHLTARRNGRNVFVALDEAARWARERGLPFGTLARASATEGDMKVRTARMTVLAWFEPDARPRNLFTLVRHRRQDALGPWASEPDERWSNDDLGHGLRVLSFDAPFDRCQAFVDRILDSGSLEIDGVDVDYALHPLPRHHWAYRDNRQLTDVSVRSPFTRHSAEIIEYWSFDAELGDRWLKVLKASPGGSLPGLGRLRFPLDRRVDRVGNLMIAGAEDAITCDLAARHDQTLRFHVDADALPPGAYRATVWGSHSGNEVIRREVTVTPGQTVIKLVSDLDHVGFSICRTADGQCVDLMEVFLIMEVSGRLEVDSSPTLHFQDRRRRLSHEVTPAGSTSMISVRSDDDSAEIDKGIRRLWLERRLHEREADARKDGNFMRFQPDEFDQAARHVVHLLRRDSHRTGPLYLADPYFMPYLDEKKPADSDLVQLYLELFAATAGGSLQILCAQKKNDNARPWWTNYPETLMNHVRVKAFFKRDGHDADRLKRGFHDRYLITPKREIIVTHSFNGWREDGVTFINLPYEVYRAEADQLWSMDLESDTERFFVEEIS